MENFIVCVNAVLPLLITMGLGYMARRMGMLGDGEIIKMNGAAFFFLMPCLMFNSIYTADLSTALKPKLLLFITVSLLLIFALSYALVRRCVADEKRQSVVLLGIFRANGPLLGLSLVKSLVPDADISAAAVLITVAATINNILAVLCMSMFSEEKSSLKDFVRAVVKNPMLIGSGLGLLFAYFGWRLPVFAERVVSELSNMSSPLLLFLLGAFFKFEGLEKFGHGQAFCGAGHISASGLAYGLPRGGVCRAYRRSGLSGGGHLFHHGPANGCGCRACGRYGGVYKCPVPFHSFCLVYAQQDMRLRVKFGRKTV